MTSQIVEEQTDLIEKRMEDFDRKFPDLGVIVGLDNDGNKVNYKTTDVVKSWIRSFASTLIERERGFTKEEQEIIKQDMEGLLRITQMTRTVKISGEPTPGMIAWMKEDQRQDKVREQIIKKIDSRTKLQEMR